MLVVYKLNDRVTLHIPVTNRVDVIDKIAAVSEAFGHPAMQKCGCCGGTDIGFRTHSGTNERGAWTMRKAKCMNKECNADLVIKCGDKDGRPYMFPDTQNQDKSEKPNGGWSIFQKKPKEEVLTVNPDVNQDVPF